MKASRRALTLAAADLRGAAVVDIRFDDHRVWSEVVPDAVDGQIVLRWPTPIRRRLSGRTRITVADSATGEVLADRHARFGMSRSRLEITDKRGVWLAMTKWDRLGPVLEGSSDDVASRLIASGARLAADMDGWGYPIYLVGGTLLGMVRGGELLPHDDDLDFAFLSDASDPAELGRISFDMERKLTAAGYIVARHSLAHLELVFFDDQGQVDHYIDIFTGFFHEGLYCQPFALRSDEVKREDLLPTSDIVVNGIPLPAPANPEAWLAYAYGEGWRIPDPTFKFVVDPRTKQRFESWFGVFNRGRFFWEKYWQGEDRAIGSPGGKASVAQLDSIIPPGSHVLDLGCGDGRWGQELAAKGHTVLGVDFSFEALRIAKGNDDYGVEYRRLNVNDRAALLAFGAELVGSEHQWHVLCTDVLSGITFANRENVMLFLRLVLGARGRAVVSFDSHPTNLYTRPDPRTWHFALPKFRALLAENGLKAEHVHTRVRRSAVGLRRHTTAVIKTGGARAQRVAWLSERDEDVR